MAQSAEERAAAVAAAAAAHERRSRRTTILDDDAFKMIAERVLGTKRPSELGVLIESHGDEFLSAIQGVSAEMIELTKDFNQLLHENDDLHEQIREGNQRIDDLQNQVELWKHRHDALARDSAAPSNSSTNRHDKSEKLPDPDAFSGDGSLEEQHHLFVVWKRQMT